MNITEKKYNDKIFFGSEISKTPNPLEKATYAYES
jgi:hypothetical protein